MKKNVYAFVLTIVAFLFLIAGDSVAQQQKPIPQPAQLLPVIKKGTTGNKSFGLARTLSTCNSDSVVLTRQSQIDSFPISHPGCTVLRELRIKGAGASPAITNLDSLYAIKEITWFFEVDSTSLIDLSGLTGLQRTSWLWLGNNPLMTDIRLPNATHIGSVLLNQLPSFNSFTGFTQSLTTTRLGYLWLFNNIPIADFNGLQSLDTIENFAVFGLPVLQSLQGLQNLVFCHDIGLWSCNSLTDVSALSGITELPNGSLKVNYNGSLTSWNGLNNITRIGGILEVIGSRFTSLNGLDTALVIENANNPNDTLRIEWNFELAACSFKPLCNYLNRSDAAIIRDNAPGCNSVPEIISQCFQCAVTNLRTWNGNVSSDWNDPGNWTPAVVPNACDSVVIPYYDDYDNEPQLSGPVTMRALTMDQYSGFETNGHNVTVRGNLQLNSANIYGGNNFSVLGAKDISILSSYIDVQNFLVRGYTGHFVSDNSYFEHNLSIEDSASRTGTNFLHESYIYGDLSITAHTTNFAATTEVSYYCYVWGNASFAVDAPVNFTVGIDQFDLAGDLIIKSDHEGYPNLHHIYFDNGKDSRIDQLGTAPIRIANVSLQKSYAELLTLDDSVSITSNFRFGNGFVKTTAGKPLIFENGSGISSFNSGSYVWGPVKKIGNHNFRFPLGNGSQWGYLDISAPSSATDAFTAEYFGENPHTYADTSLRQNSLKGILGKEYWTLVRNRGTSGVTVTLRYDSTLSGAVRSLEDLHIARWDGAQWADEGLGTINGHFNHADISSDGNVSAFGAFAFGYYPTRIPVITMGNIDSIVCKGRPFNVPFTLDTLMFGNNVFTVQLSDGSGSFDNPWNIGSKTTKQSDTIQATVPILMNIRANATKKTQAGNYQIRIVGSAPRDTSVNTRSLVVQESPEYTGIAGPANVCIGTTYKYYAEDKEEGVSYAWQLTQGSATLSQNHDTLFLTPTAAGPLSLTLSIANSCDTVATNFTGINTLAPPPAATPTLNNIGRWLYASTPLPAGAQGYHWYRNDTLISGAAASSYYASAAGSYTVRYYAACGDGSASNAISFAATSLPQTINFPTIADKVFTDAPFNLNATTSSGLPVQYQLVTGPGSIAGNTYTITSTGNVTIRAFQLGDNVYDTAVSVFQTFAVNKGSQTINFPTVSDQTLGTPSVALNASSSSGLPITYNVVSGPATVSGNVLFLTGVGSVAVRASQAGNNNYSPAAPVDQTFCIRVASLNTIAGPQFICPNQSVTYSITNISGVIYNWRLSNGTILPSTTSSVSFSIGASGSYTLQVSASGPCGAPTADASLTVNVVTPVTPGAVSNMLPGNGAAGLALPLTLSWLPGSNALTYDLYVWDAETTQPSAPFAANLTSVSYTLAANALTYNKTYKWRVVSKNACLQTAGTIQEFTLKPLPDLTVSQIQIPASAFSGQTVSFSWRVTNNGPGNTTTNQSWSDAVFLSFDTMPNFSIPPNTNPLAWQALDFPIKPLLIGTRPNVTALDAGQHYTNTINFTLPLNYSQPLYVYVIANYQPGNNAPVEMSMTNNTGRAADSINVVLSPTPDLRVDTVVTPASVFSGSTIHLTYKVKNYGVLTPAGSSWSDRFYISQSPLFNINTAVPLKFRKLNDSYYPNAQDAIVANNVQLQADSAYTRAVEVVVPNFVFGSFFIYVVTNYNNGVYEGALANNNTGQSGLQVFLTPTPQLTINAMTVPVATASTTQPIGINWNIFNTGFNNNIEKNKGHFYVKGGNCQIPPPPCPPGPPGSICVTGPTTPGTLYRDSMGFGGSYWVDKVYLSTDAGGLNTASAIFIGEKPHGSQNSGLFVNETLQEDKCLPLGSNSSGMNQNTTNVILPGSNHPATFNFAVPNDLLPGNYYVYVVANATKQVYEYPGTLQVRRSAAPVMINRPDLTVQSVTVASNSIGGQPVKVEYEVKNIGAGSVFNASRSDRIYVSTSSTFDGAAELLTTRNVAENVAAGATTLHTYTHTFAPGTSGTRYFFVVTNYDSTFRETAHSNNISAPAITNFTAAVANDLVISSFSLADSVYTLNNSYIKYSVVNNGTGTTAGSWMDSLFISCSPTFNPGSAYYISRRQHNRELGNGGSYADSFNVSLPLSFHINNCFPATTYSTVYFFLKTNADNVVFEGSNTANNTLSSGPRVLVNPLADHIVTNVTGADLALVARPYTVTWTVKNLGFNAAYPYYANWFDEIYLSADSVFSLADIQVNYFYENQRLATDQSYTRSRAVVIPNIATGDYYVFAASNPRNHIVVEKNLSNNANLIRNADGSAKKIQVSKPDLPDLIDSIVTAPTSVAVGQPLTLVHLMKNGGPGATYPEKWSNEIWLSNDFIPGNAGDIRIAAKNYNGVLSPSQTRTDTIEAAIALNITPGNYILISSVDALNNVVETADSNNLAFGFITIFKPDPADLLVQQVVKPDTVYLGYTIDTVKWVIANNSPNKAEGVSRDGIYLSKSNTLDSTAALVGIVNKRINIPALGKDTLNLQPLVSNVTEGAYNLLVKTDLLNNIVESDKTNNVGVAVGNIYVKVKELLLSVPQNNTLHTVNRLYKLVVPDSLNGSTILVTLKTPDSLTVRNEMFIGQGFVPSPASFTYRFETANYGNQQIVMSSVANGVYYIMVRTASPNPPVQNITLKAVKLPFAILNVQSSQGGNIGNVTVKLSGSLFTNNMVAKLVKGGTTLTASQLYFTNSTQVFATFLLKGAPLGLYDVVLSKPDATEAALANAFTVVPANNGGLLTGGGNNTGGSGSGNEPGCDPGTPSGLNSQLVTELVIPEKVFAGWPFVVQINYTNPTNYDVPAQARILYNDKAVPVALTQAALADAKTSLYIEFTEPGGPPGIIRAGASGTITVYAKAPVSMPGHTYVQFNLK